MIASILRVEAVEAKTLPVFWWFSALPIRHFAFSRGERPVWPHLTAKRRDFTSPNGCGIQRHSNEHFEVSPTTSTSKMFTGSPVCCCSILPTNLHIEPAQLGDMTTNRVHHVIDALIEKALPLILEFHQPAENRSRSINIFFYHPQKNTWYLRNNQHMINLI